LLVCSVSAQALKDRRNSGLRDVIGRAIRRTPLPAANLSRQGLSCY
jgi:hypothetical protein